MDPLFEHTKNNHYKWGWEGEDWYGPPQPDKHYQLHLGHVTQPYGSLREEAVKAAKHIADKATKPIIVGLSGGSDSQMVCLSLLDAKIPFQALICKYRYSTGQIVNEHDISTAYKFCKKFNVAYKEFEIDIDKFFKTRGPELAARYCMPKTETIIQTAAMDAVCKDYCYIMAGGDIMIVPLYRGYADRAGFEILNDRFSVPVWWESPVPVMQHMIASGYEGTSKFWLYTPELIASYLDDPITKMFLENYDVITDSYLDLTGNEEGWKCFHYLYKPLMTYREFPEIIRSKKYTGYENLYAGRVEVPGRMSVYNQLLQDAVKHLKPAKEVTTSISDLIDYIKTPHGEEQVLKSNYI